jgi:hypothetical protein
MRILSSGNFRRGKMYTIKLKMLLYNSVTCNRKELLYPPDLHLLAYSAYVKQSQANIIAV